MPFLNEDNLRQRSVHGLDQMLAQHDSLGVYILVLANAAQEPLIWQALRENLVERHRQHAVHIQTALRQGTKLNVPEDDLVVFLKLMVMALEGEAFDQLQVSPRRQIGPWEVQFNPLRALRPARMSEARTQGSHQPFDANGFHFNKPFLAKEVLWEGELLGKTARLLYNKFPFAPLHGLLAPEPELELPQLLMPRHHLWAWQVAQHAGAAMPGFGLAYNSYGAYASVNHLHFQTFVRAEPLPVQTMDLAHYPLPVQRFDSVEHSWQYLDELHGSATPYNLIYDAGGVSVIPRVRQGEVAVQTWSPGFAWSELAGAFSVGAREEFNGLTEGAIEGAMRAWGKVAAPSAS